MATKKQKRAAALAKRARFLETYRRQGLEAQRNSRIDENLSNLTQMLYEQLGRIPTEDEVMAFIYGDEDKRLSIINGGK